MELGNASPISIQFTGLARSSFDCYTHGLRLTPVSKGNRSHAQCPRSRKRALRGRASPLQAHDRKDGPPDRASRPRVLRKADVRTQAEKGGRHQAPLQAAAQPAAAAEAL